MNKHLPFFAAVVFVSLSSCSENETPPPAKGKYEAAPVTPLACLPNLDGRIESRELAPQIGIPSTYLVTPPGKERAVDLAGRINPAGKLEWGFGVDFADDAVASIAAQKLEAKWYAGSFASVPNPVVVAIDVGGRTEGVYTHDEQGFFLHGVASAEADPPEGRTLLVYDTPIMLYRFPLEPGAAWTSVGVVRDGRLRGLPIATRDTYEVRVDAAGQINLPDFILTQALRVRTTVTISPSPGQVTTQRQVGFLFECIGEVARATSKLNETADDFTAAMELRRLGLAP